MNNDIKQWKKSNRNFGQVVGTEEMPSKLSQTSKIMY